jgi:type I restriction enzyme S subunit
MSEWKEYKLADLCEAINYGYTASANTEPLGPKFLRITDIVPQRVNWLEVPYCVLSKNDHKKYKLEKGDIVIARTGATTGYNYMFNNDIDAVYASYLIRYRINKKIALPTFINYILKSSRWVSFVEGMIGGSAQPGANAKMFGQFEIVLPSLEEQYSIVSILSSLDDKIDLLHRQNKTLEALAETLFRQWFFEEADESWEEKTLGEILTITSSKRIYYSEYVPFGIPFYRSKEIIELHNSGKTNSELFISEERFNEIKEKFGAPQEGDILMTSVGTLGITYKVKKNDKFYFKDGNLTWFKDFKLLPSSIIYLWLNSIIGQEQLASITIGSTQEALTIDGLKGILFKVPPSDKLEIYKREFESILNRIEYNQNQIRALTQLRDTLLPKLMSGEVRV